MKNLFLLSILGFSLLGLTNCSDDDDNEQAVSNEEKVVAVLKSIETGDSEPIAYINSDQYTQHNQTIADGLAGFGAALAELPEGSARVKTVRVFQDGDYVFAHTDYNFFGPKIGFDIFRFENGLIVEHWDNLQETATELNPSGHSMIDGTTYITDITKTEANKTLVKNFVSDILVDGNMDVLGNYFDGDNYIQHNPSIGDGLSGLGEALDDMAANGIEMIYTTIHKVLGQGNFVLVVSEGTFAGNHTAYYDLFRVENDKIAEHWDVIETITDPSEAQNSNGKFNF